MAGMEMYVAPAWLTALSWAFVVAALASAAWIARDLRARGALRPSATVAVWLAGALAVGPLAVWIYARWGRSSDPGTMGEALRTGLAGGAASGVAHVIGVPLVVLTGMEVAGLDLWAMMLVIAVLAIGLLVLIELAAQPARRARLRGALGAATLTVLAFDVGMGAWMIGLHFGELMPAPTDVAFTFLMQLGIVLGLLTGLPVVAWLVRRQPVVATSGPSAPSVAPAASSVSSPSPFTDSRVA